MRACHITSVLLALTFASPVYADTAAPTQPANTVTPQAAGLWSKLWQTPDQRAQSLLQKGDAAGAAAAFNDPRHKAYAQAQAGDNAAAVESLAEFDDAEAQYNRANALARSGDLQSALDAYDAALSKDPSLEDAQHNRKLVEQALQQQKQQEQQQQSKDGDGQPQDDKQSKDGSESQKQGDQNQSQSGKGNNGQSKDASSQNGAQSSEQQQQSGDSSKQEDPQQADADNQAQSQSAQKQADAQENEDQSNNAEQAHRDASAGLAAQQQGSDSQPPADSHQAAAASTEKPDNSQPQQDAPAAVVGDGEAPSEKQLAQDQWLRRIPDDPGGLLRRKFMIEHLMKQQQEAQP